jgi:hypothetical protein
MRCGGPHHFFDGAESLSFPPLLRVGYGEVLITAIVVEAAKIINTAKATTHTTGRRITCENTSRP